MNKSSIPNDMVRNKTSATVPALPEGAVWGDPHHEQLLF